MAFIPIDPLAEAGAGESLTISPEEQLRRDRARLGLLQSEAIDHPDDSALRQEIALTESNLSAGTPFGARGPRAAPQENPETVSTRPVSSSSESPSSLIPISLEEPRSSFVPIDLNAEPASESPRFKDFLKSMASGALAGAGMTFQGGGELLARGINAVSGTELRAVNPLQGAIDYLNKSKSEGAKKAEAGSEITGSLFDPSTYSFGSNPTLSGLALQGLNAIGQFAPNLAIAVATAGASIPAQLAIGATVGGLQALGGGIDQEREQFQGMRHEELLTSSKLYRTLIDQGVDPDVAKNAVGEAAAVGGGIGNAIPSAAEGSFENFLIGALTRGRIKIPALFGKGVTGKVATGVLGGAAMGGTEEAVEQIGQNIGSNLAIGGNRPLTSDTLQQFVMGALAEGAAGSGAATLQHVFRPADKAEALLAQPSIEPILNAPDVSSAIRAADAAIATPLSESSHIPPAGKDFALSDIEPLGGPSLLTPPPEITTGPRTQQQVLAQIAQDAEASRATRQKEADLDALQIARPEPTAMQLAMQRAEQRKAEDEARAQEKETKTAEQARIQAETARQEALTPKADDLPILDKLARRAPLNEAEQALVLEKGYGRRADDGSIRIVEKGFRTRQSLRRAQPMTDQELSLASRQTDFQVGARSQQQLERLRQQPLESATAESVGTQEAPQQVTQGGVSHAISQQVANAGRVLGGIGTGNAEEGQAVRARNAQPQEVAGTQVQAQQTRVDQQQNSVALPVPSFPLRPAIKIIGGTRDGTIVTKPNARTHGDLGFRAAAYPDAESTDLGFVDATGRYFSRAELDADASELNKRNLISADKSSGGPVAESLTPVTSEQDRSGVAVASSPASPTIPKIGGKLVTNIKTEDLQKFAKRGGSRIRLIAQSELDSRAEVVAKSERGVAMFSRAEDLSFAQHFLEEFATEDAAFRHPVSPSSDLQTVFEDVAPDFEFKGNATRPAEHQESGADRRYMFQSQEGHDTYVYERGRDVWIDISRLRTGEGGDAFYAAVFNYAYNTGKKVIGDPAGLSEDAIIRRTSAMLSSALRFGTTRHMEAAAEQIRGKPDKGIAPLNWRGTDFEKVNALIDSFVTTLYNKIPALKNFHYDFAKGQFIDANGNVVDRGRFLEGAKQADSRTGRAGQATLRRGILLQSLTSSSGSARPGILEQVLRRSRQLAGEGNLGAVLSRQTEVPPRSGLSRSTVESVQEEIGAEVGKTKASKIRIVQSLADLPAPQRAQVFSQRAYDVQAIYDPDTDTVLMVADNILRGRAFAVAMHDVGVHKGMKRLLGPENFRRLVEQVKVWSRMRGDGEQIRLARKAANRVPENTAEVVRDEELLAYFTEEAVIAGHGEPKPTQQGPIQRWFGRLWEAIRSAMAKLGTDPAKLTVGDVVALARGSLERSLSGEKVGAGSVYAAAAPSQTAAPSAANSQAGQQTRFSLSTAQAIQEEEPVREHIPPWAEKFTDAQKDALLKSGIIFAEPKLVDRVKRALKDFGKTFVQGTVDQFAPIRELDQRAYMQARLSKATDGGVEALLLYGRPFLNSGALDVRFGEGGFLKVLQSLRNEHDRFFAWVAAQRAAGLKAQGRENLLTDEDISFLKTLNRNDGSWDGRQVAYATALARLQAYNKAVLDIAEQQSLIDGESRSLWESQFYVPFFRVMEEGVAGPSIKSGLVRQYAFKKLKGGQENLNDLLKNTIMNWAHLLSAAQKNGAAKATIEAAVKTGIAHEVEEGTKDAVWFLEKGQKRNFLIDDPHIMDAITAIEWGGFGQWMKPIAAFRRIMTLGVTANPTFKVRNLIRDTISAVGQNPISFNIWKNIVQGFQATAHDSPTRASMIAGGGIFRFGTMLEGDRAQHLKRLIESGVDRNTVLDTPERIKALFQKAWDIYQEFGDRSENVNRAALFEQLRAKGYDNLEANFFARDMLDFSMSGRWAAIRFLTQSVPFMNARIQGLYKLGRSAKEDPRRAAYVTGAIALASLALIMAYKDDDDFKKREDFDRDNYWWFKFGGVAFRIPKPFELGAIGTVAERTYELAFDKEMSAKRYGSRLADIVSQQLNMSPVPQLVKPLVDLYANQDSFTGRQIESIGMEKLRKQDRFTGNTTFAARAVGLLGLPDPLQFVQGRYEAISPVQADFLIRGYFGWLGSLITSAADYGIRPLAGAPERPAMKLRDVFLAGNFVESLPATQSRYVTELYQQAQEIEQAYGSWRQALKQGDPEKAKEIYEAERENIRKFSLTETVKRRLSALNAQVRRVENSSADSETKRRLLDNLAGQKDKIARRITAAP